MSRQVRLPKLSRIEQFGTNYQNSLLRKLEIELSDIYEEIVSVTSSPEIGSQTIGLNMSHWGSVVTNVSGLAYVTFPTQYGEVPNIILTTYSSNPSGNAFMANIDPNVANSPSATGFGIITKRHDNIASSQTVNWFSIGRRPV